MQQSHSDHDHHDHSHGLHSHATAPQAIGNAIFVTLVFMTIEALGGWYANSLALLSDAAHMLTDLGAMFLSLFAIWVSRRPSNSKMSFGYHRAEILGALASGLTIWALSGALIYSAFFRLRHPVSIQGGVVFIVAVVGLAANLFAMRMLHHAQNHNINAKAAYLHMITDAMGSMGAIIAGALLYLTHWSPIDPLITIFFAVLMLVSSWGLVAETVGILMESTPSGVDAARVKTELEQLQGIREAHDLHIWTVSSGRLALSVHLVAEKSQLSSAQAILHSANTLLEEKYGIVHTTIQIEQPESFRLDRCYDCTHK